jgi:hypothetical protein
MISKYLRSLLVIILVLPYSVNGDSIPFAPPVVYGYDIIGNQGANRIVLGDTDNDADIDIIIAGDIFDGGGGFTILANDMHGSFSLNQKVPRSYNDGWGYGDYGIALGDIDGDSNNEIIGGPRCYIYDKNGEGIFVKSDSLIQPEHELCFIVVSDLDKDGDSDLVVSHVSWAGITSFMTIMNNGNGTYSDSVIFASGKYHYEVAVGDLNKDGYPDLAVLNTTSKCVTIFLNNGHGVFIDTINYALEYSPRTISIIDLDNDNNLDLAIGNRDSYGISILYNLGDGSFANPSNYAVGTCSGIFATGDYDLDGDIDIMTTYGVNISFLINDANRGFSPLFGYSVNYGIQSIHCADLDADGDLDIVVNNGSWISSIVSILLNRSSYLCGDANSDTKVNLLDVSHLINYLYRSGSAPNPIRSADADHNGKINLLDVSYIISFLYRHGPAPNCPIKIPVLATANVSEITEITARCGGIIDGGTAVLERGVCWSTYSLPTVADSRTVDGSGAGSFTSYITDLIEKTTYFARAYATNSGGTGYGNEVTFTTSAILPAITTLNISEITETTAQCGGIITSDGGATVTARGVCWSTNPMPTVADSKTQDGAGIGSFSSSINGLTGNTTYYLMAYATNCAGTGYGDAITFTTSPILPVITTLNISEITETTAQSGGIITSDGGATVTARGVCWSINSLPTVADDRTVDGSGSGSFASSITGLTGITIYYVRAYATNSVGTSYGNIITCTTTDIDGNTYQIIKIGDQWWMAENLKVTHYRNGEAIPNVTDGATWAGLTTGAYCEYNNNINNVAIYGRLYNWYAVNDGRNLAPVGWHVPSDAELQILIDYFGGSYATVRGGYRVQGLYLELGNYATLWSSTEYDNYNAWYRNLKLSEAFHLYYNKEGGFSVRCVKD